MFKDYAKSILVDRINNNLKDVTNEIKVSEATITNVVQTSDSATVVVEFTGGKFDGKMVEVTTDLITPKHETIYVPHWATREMLWLALVTDYGILLNEEEYEQLPESSNGDEEIGLSFQNSYRYKGELSIFYVKDSSILSSMGVTVEEHERYLRDDTFWDIQKPVRLPETDVFKLWMKVFNGELTPQERAWYAATLVCCYNPDYVEYQSTDRLRLLDVDKAEQLTEGTTLYTKYLAGETVVAGLLNSNAGSYNPEFSWDIKFGVHANLLELVKNPFRISAMLTDIDVSKDVFELTIEPTTFAEKHKVREEIIVTDENIEVMEGKREFIWEFNSKDDTNVISMLQYSVKNYDSFALNDPQNFSTYFSFATEKEMQEGIEMGVSQTLYQAMLMYCKDKFATRVVLHYAVEKAEDGKVKIIHIAKLTYPEHIKILGGVTVTFRIVIDVENPVVEAEEEYLLMGMPIEEFVIDKALGNVDTNNDPGLMMLSSLSRNHTPSLRSTAIELSNGVIEQNMGDYENYDFTKKSAFVKDVDGKVVTFSHPKTYFVIKVTDAVELLK